VKGFLLLRTTRSRLRLAADLTMGHGRDRVGMGKRLLMCSYEIAAEAVRIAAKLPEGRRFRRS
jgi:hypothetical protein